MKISFDWMMLAIILKVMMFYHSFLSSHHSGFSAKVQEAVDFTLKADLVILDTAVAGKSLDAVLKENVACILPKVLWWIHGM